jgi:hypothetical protein
MVVLKFTFSRRAYRIEMGILESIKKRLLGEN